MQTGAITLYSPLPSGSKAHGDLQKGSAGVAVNAHADHHSSPALGHLPPSESQQVGQVRPQVCSLSDPFMLTMTEGVAWCPPIYVHPQAQDATLFGNRVFVQLIS